MTKARETRGRRSSTAKRSAFSRLVLKLHRPHRHHGRNRVLVDQLGMAIAAQQDAEIVEPGDVALELDAIDQEDGDGSLAFTDRV